MKIKLTLEIEFESWFEPDREPVGPDEWKDFFERHIMPEGNVIGTDDGEFQDQVCVNQYAIEVINFES